ncbi:hypothetical protein D6867_12170 [Streptococcus pseudopneumoniae]|uniref:Transposase n=1 Tax=Streptococcus pseudopneumoniae TaxID=257758 RepID=A0ABX9P9V0_9STRE|nr:hypothetical protein D6867_12170 [Streptococcus pseudopneumoniae]
MLIQRLVRLAKRLLLIEKKPRIQLSKFQPKARLTAKSFLQVSSVMKKMRLETEELLLRWLTERMAM